MILIKNKILPIKGYKAISIFPFVFYKGDKPNKKTLNHERIHLKQQLELLIILFYIIYLVEWIFKGYWSVSFEKEAYEHEYNYNYLKDRKLFNMWRK